MALDGFTLSFLTTEMSAILADARVDKIYQPDSRTLVFMLRKDRQNHRLLISCHPQTGRFCLTSEKTTNPETPPMFCMVLRKHLEGARLSEIRQVRMERIAEFVFLTTNELGDPVTKVLIGEFMGKHSNLLLIDPETETIHDAIMRFGLQENTFREILPGKKYYEPPAQDKYLLSALTTENIEQVIIREHLDKTAERAILSTVSGTGPATAREICLRSQIDPQMQAEELGSIDFQRLAQTIKEFDSLRHTSAQTCYLIQDGQRYLDFTPFSYQIYENCEQIPYSSINQLIEEFMGGRDKTNRIKQRKDHLLRMIQKEASRLEKRYDLNQQKIKDSAHAEQFRIYGDLLTANLYQLKQGKRARVTNYFSQTQEEIVIPLDEQLTPNQNAQRYYRKYNKAKAGAENAHRQLSVISDELTYLESILISIENSEDLITLEEIRLEMTEAGYLKNDEKKTKKKKAKDTLSLPSKYQHLGYDIYLGHNNKQNDYLTMKFASPEDIWFHVKDIPGSHVLVKNPNRTELPEEVIRKAAELAAKNSKAKNARLVTVDYTRKKHVKKPKGSKPGFVLYDNANTIEVTIKPDL